MEKFTGRIKSREGDDMKASAEYRVKIEMDSVALEGMLELPQDAQGVVLFAHGSGSSRFSPRNQYVARVLRERCMGTLLMDLLEESESQDRNNVFNIDLLAARVMGADAWLRSNEDTEGLPVGYFGASTGAAAALLAASKLGRNVSAVVSRGGRPDLAMEYLPAVTAPVLLIVGGDDWPVISMNRDALENLPGTKELKIIPGATHLFEEPGALEQVAQLASEWFLRYMLVDES
jgi:putative phosphoribosyl transferase